MKKEYFEYIGEDLFTLHTFCSRLVDAVKSEQFEYDTAEFDAILHGIKNSINKIDI